ncbi:MAG: hypothetical protein AAGA48_14625 [Myxococcota bacterium]
MSPRILASVVALAALAACAVDGDLDGLSNAEEREWGSDPENPDSDGDGLLDGAEIEYGSDPTLVDSDEDGYTDRDEVYEGSDPADADSGIYVGGWPYVYDKSAINQNLEGFRAIGERFMRFQMIDQHGEMVDLYDFHNDEGIPIVIDISAEWCPPCRGLASWIEGGDDPYNFGQLWPSGPRKVRRGKVHWLTILGEDQQGQKPDLALAERWAEEYDSPEIPVLADERQVAEEYAGLPFWPTVLLLEPDLTMSEENDDNFGSAATILRALENRL